MENKATKLDKTALSILASYGLIAIFAFLVILEAWNS